MQPDVLPEQFRHRRAHADLALALALTKHLDVALALAVDLIEVVDSQAGQLAQPDACVSHERDHGIVAEPQRRRRVARIQHRFQMLDGERLDDVLTHLWHREASRWVFVEQFLEVEPAAKSLDDLRVAVEREI